MEKLIAGLGIGWILVLLGVGIMWVVNIVKLISTISDPITLLTVLRGVGIFVFPLGAILGFF